MKKLTTLSLCAFILISGILSCTNEKNMDAELITSKFKLVSPDGFVLADSDSDLKNKLGKELETAYGKGYEFDIASISYTMIPGDITYAEIDYTTKDGLLRNFIYFWPKDEIAETATDRAAAAEPRPAPICNGECVEDATQCRVTYVYEDNEGIWMCDCSGSGGNNCKMTFGGTILTCSGTCGPGGEDVSDDEECEPAMTRRGKLKFFCRCDNGKHGRCTPDIGPNPV